MLQFFFFFIKFFFFSVLATSPACGIPKPGIRSELHLWSKPQLLPYPIPNPLYQARDQTCVLVLPRCCQFHSTMVLFVEKTFLSVLNDLGILIENQLAVWVYFWGLSLLFHWSECLSLCQDHIFFISLVLCYILSVRYSFFCILIL